MSFAPSEEEERYFSKRNAEARERIRQELESAAQQASDGRVIGQTLGTEKEAVIARLQDMGFDADKARVFDLLPLVHVAWADGKVQASERRVILDILAQRGIESDSEAWLLIEALLEQRPSDTFLEEISPLLIEVVERKVPDVRKALRSYRDQILRQITNGAREPSIKFN
jgi:hypothetical protein